MTVENKLPFFERFNWRIWVVVGIALLLVGYPVYQFMSVALTGGIGTSKDEKGEFHPVELRAMSLFEMSQTNATEESIPKKWRELDGKRVELEGEMYLGNSAAGKQADFNLVYSIAKCCVTGSPKIQHFVKCTAPAGKVFPKYEGLVSVKGKLHVSIEKDPEVQAILSIYRLDVESVKPK